MSLIPIRRALISVSKKDHLIEFAKTLQRFGVEILSTGNTATILEAEKIPVTKVSDFTGSPEILDGRVKTLHPKIHGGLLARRNDPEHQKELRANDIQPIDLVVVNLYPFEETLQKLNQPLSTLIENIDIGGPSMIRSAAKNFESVAVLVDPADYSAFTAHLELNDGNTDQAFRFKLAKKAFAHTAAYDGVISQYLSAVPLCGFDEVPVPEKFPEILNLQVTKAMDLRYGENPHQQAAFYRKKEIDEPCVSNAEILHGKELSFNNLLDLDSALEAVKEFETAGCVVVKHNNPCGVALSASISEAFLQAKACDPVSAFGGIVAVNRKIDVSFATLFNETFFEALIAPDYDDEALSILKSKKNLRILKLPRILEPKDELFDFKRITGGLLLQDRDRPLLNLFKARVVTRRAPTQEEFKAFDFAWKVAKHVRSNAIVYVKGTRTIGIGAGQMSRIDSVRLAAMKAEESVEGSVMASDAFFPFRDGIDEAAKHKISAIIQPGGSVRDAEVIAAADEHGISMVFTGIRHFRH